MIAAALCVSANVHAEWNFSGTAKFLLSQIRYAPDDLATMSLNRQDFTDLTATGRLMASDRWDKYDFNIHYQLGALNGDSFALAPSSTLVASSSLPNDDARLLDLTQVLEKNDKGGMLHRLDRLNVGYAGAHLVWRLGRQAISWGNGLVFQPMDIFNPFSPLAIDTEYKPGDDLLYTQWLFDSGDDLQFIYLPRRDTATGRLSPGQDSTALKYHSQTAWGGWDLLVARHYDEDILAIGHVQDVGGAVWRLDVNQTSLKDGRIASFAVTNLDYSWVAFDHNFYGFIEYFFNSLGQDKIDLLTLGDALRERLQRGELFTLGRRELALGTTMELTPRWQLNGTAIANLGDSSAILRLQASYDWREDSKLLFGAQAGLGARGTEYGGLDSYSPTYPGSYLGLGSRVYLYIQQYY
jgi:hypothetical protein